MELRKLLRTVLLAASLAFVLVLWTNVGLGQNNVTPDESVFAMLPESLISLQLNEADLKSVLRALGKEYRLNLLVHEEVNGLITLGLENIALRDALQAIARTRGLTLVPGPGGTIEILPLETYRSRVEKVVAVTRRTPPVESPPPSPLITQKIDVQYAFNPRESISSVGRDIGLSGKQVKDLTELADLLEKRLSGQPGSDITPISRLNALVVTDTPEKVEEIINIVNTIDVPSVTVGIEARIVEVTNQALEDLGIQWGGLGQFGDARITGGGLGASTGDEPEVPQSGNVGLSGSNFIVNLPATIPLGGPGSSLGFTLGRSATKVLDIQLSALERDGKLKLLAAPRLTTMNHERAWIESGTEIPFRNQSVSGGGVTTFTVEFKSASIELEVTPHVVGDSLSQAVFLDAVVTRKEADFARAIDGNPPLLSRTIYTRALVKTGETVVIGGLMRDDTTDTIEKVPWVSDLPFVGWMFRRTQERDEKSQLMIFLTPSILPTPLTKAASIKTAMPQINSRQQAQDQEAKRPMEYQPQSGRNALPNPLLHGAQSEKSTTDYGLQTTGPLTTETPTTNQPSAESEGQSAKSQESEIRDQISAKTESQSAGNRQSEVSGQTSAKQNTERQAAEGSEQEKGQQDQEAKRKEQIDDRPRTGLQTTNQQSANQKTERQEAVGSKQEKGQEDQEAKRKEQSDNRPRTTGPQTTDHGLLSPQHSDLGTPLPADRIW